MANASVEKPLWCSRSFVSRILTFWPNGSAGKKHSLCKPDGLAQSPELRAEGETSFWEVILQPPRMNSHTSQTHSNKQIKIIHMWIHIHRRHTIIVTKKKRIPFLTFAFLTASVSLRVLCILGMSWYSLKVCIVGLRHLSPHLHFEGSTIS